MANLIIDIGNTYAKLALFEGNELLDLCKENQSFPNAFSQLAQGVKIKSAIISSVIDLKPETLAFIRSFPFPVLFLTPATPLPIKIRYQSVSSLGVDRIAAVTAADESHPKENILIIDAGTAITYDFFSDKGEFIGGNITPGKQMRFEILHNRAPRLPLIDENGDKPLTGYDTASAIRGGVMRSIAYEMDGYIRDYQTKYPDINVILTGGDAKLFTGELEKEHITDPHLVLKGLNRILHYNESL